MTVIERKPVPIYAVVCPECGSKIEYRKSEVHTCHINCPICGVSIWADTIRPVRMEDYEPSNRYIGGRCPYLCWNKTDFGYCKSTACINQAHNGSGTYTIDKATYDAIRMKNDSDYGRGNNA